MPVLQRGERDETVAAEQSPQVIRTWTLPGVGINVLEGLAEHNQQGLHQRNVIRREMVNHERHGPLLSCMSNGATPTRMSRMGFAFNPSTAVEP